MKAQAFSSFTASVQAPIVWSMSARVVGQAHVVLALALHDAAVAQELVEARGIALSPVSVSR